MEEGEPKKFKKSSLKIRFKSHLLPIILFPSFQHLVSSHLLLSLLSHPMTFLHVILMSYTHIGWYVP